MEKEILDIKEASALLRIGVRTMYNLVQKGVIPGRKIGGRWRFSRTSLLSLFDSNTRFSNPETGSASSARGSQEEE